MDGWDDIFVTNFLNDEFSLKLNRLIEDGHDVPRAKTDKQKLDTSSTDRKDTGFRFSSGPSVETSKIDVHKPITRSGLSERRPAWSGFTTPKINTTRVISAKLDSSASEVSSPYLTISPGLSPTTLLDSPELLSNTAQPSPTTGKMLYDKYDEIELVSTSRIPEKARDHCTLEHAPELFAFKPHLEPNSYYFSSADNKVLTSIEAVSIPFPNQNDLNLQTELSNSSDSGDPSEKVLDSCLLGNYSPLLNDQKDEVITAEQTEDGYNWRKYGQKQVRGSDYPRSYYKCTHLNCPIKKKVERSHEGHITKIIYKGVHNHIEATANHWLTTPDNLENASSQVDLDGNLLMTTSQDNNQGATSEFGDPSASTDNEEDWEAHDGERDETESKRRKTDASVIDMTQASRAVREPRVVVRTASEIDILDDGYRWRKYGQKVVKGNPNPRSYYKCTSLGCSVRKLVERASNDLKSVITTYEGKHNHDVPAARGNNHSNSASSTTSVTAISRPQPQVLRRRPDLTQAQHGLPTLSGFALPMRQQGVNNLGVMELSAVTPMKASALHQVHPHYGYRQAGENTGLMIPKEEPNQMPLQESGQTKLNAAAVFYHRMMNRLHLGNHQQ